MKGNNESPTYKRFSKDFLSGIFDSFDSLEIAELAIPGTTLDFDRGRVVSDEILSTGSNREQRMAMLEMGLLNGHEFRGNLFGIPVILKPVPKDEASPGLEESGDREPRDPIRPLKESGAVAEVVRLVDKEGDS